MGSAGLPVIPESQRGCSWNKCSALRIERSTEPQAGSQTCTAFELGPNCTWLVINLVFFLGLEKRFSILCEICLTCSNSRFSKKMKFTEIKSTQTLFILSLNHLFISVHRVGQRETGGQHHHQQVGIKTKITHKHSVSLCMVISFKQSPNGGQYFFLHLQSSKFQFQEKSSEDKD